VHRQAVDNKEKKNYIQTYVERMGAQNEEKKFKEKKRATVDQRQKKRINIVRTTERCFRYTVIEEDYLLDSR
jgi:hypothetical protein